MSTQVDTRYLKSGQIRLRWKLNDTAIAIIHQAILRTDYKKTNASLEAICMNYLTSGKLAGYQCRNMTGNKRLLVKLFPEQYEMVREALDTANLMFKSDSDSLVNICQGFILSTKNVAKKELSLGHNNGHLEGQQEFHNTLNHKE